MVNSAFNSLTSKLSTIANDMSLNETITSIFVVYFSVEYTRRTTYNQNMVVISTKTYNTIRKFYENFNGLSHYCEQEAKKTFSDIHPYTVTAILSKEWQKNTRYQHHNIQRVAKLIMSE